MKRGKNVLEQLKSSPYFTKEMVMQLGSSYELTPAAVNTLIARALKQKNILSLKRGLYVSANFYNEHKQDSTYLFYLANVIRKPSYVSSWTALQYHGLTTDAIRTVISITPKVTRSYETKVGSFSYSSITEKLFSGFELKKGNFDFFVATPAKALFDLVYFKTRRFKGVTFKQIPVLVQELRIDIADVDPKEREAFYSLVKEYIHHE